VRRGKKPIKDLNELEYIGDDIWANIYGYRKIAIISPETGCVRQVLDFSEIMRDLVKKEIRKNRQKVCPPEGCWGWDFVLNGIAYDSATDRVYITGKNWPMYLVFKRSDIL
jgi:glutamine cyclotransferase